MDNSRIHGQKIGPFEQGYAAFLAGLQRVENPFDKDTAPISLRHWIDGWNKAYLARQEKQV